MSKTTNLILLGGGNSCIEIIDLIGDINRFNLNQIKIIGILDDNPKIKNKKINGIKVLGKINTFKKYSECNFFLNILSYKNRFVRFKIINKLKKIKKKFINLIHPSSMIGKGVSIGFGNCIYNNCNIFSGTSINDFNILMPSISIASNSSLRTNNFLGKNISIGIKTNIKNNCSIQSNCTILENVTLYDGIRVMPNSLISRSFMKKNILIGGYPARYVVNEKK